MRERVPILIALVLVVVMLIGITAASYLKVEEEVDSEQNPDRSTFNAGATGTRALFEFLRESGQQVARWRDTSSSLLTGGGPRPTTLVVIGQTPTAYTDTEAKEVLSWVENGGRLVLIDRSPDYRLLPSTADWKITTRSRSYPEPNLDPTDLQQMTAGVKPLAPSQPTALVRNVESILPSRFASSIEIGHRNSQYSFKKDSGISNSSRDDEPPEAEPSPEDDSDSLLDDDPDSSDTAEGLSPAPVVHFAQERGGLLIDYKYGNGRIVLLSDPYLVANNGISRANNLALAVNVVVGPGGLIAFDEYHQGRAATHNALIHYFSGTPVMALCGQLALIAFAIVWSRGRRFARPLPLPKVDRRSSLEFVASMAELQQRARAHDLALENIYGRVRRVLVRYAGLNNNSTRAQIASRVSLRSGISRQQLETLMQSCEDTINGAPTNAKESLRMVRRLRQIESRLGLGGRARDEKQEKIEL